MMDDKPQTKMGRPTKYQDDFPEVARRLCIIGCSDQQIAEFLGVNLISVRRWMMIYPDFCSAMTRNAAEELRMVKRSLLLRATGYSRRVKKDFVLSEGKGQGTYIATKRRTMYVEPDVRAAIAWLQVYDPEWSANKIGESATDDEVNESITKLIGSTRKTSDGSINDKSNEDDGDVD